MPWGRWALLGRSTVPRILLADWREGHTHIPDLRLRSQFSSVDTIIEIHTLTYMNAYRM